LTFTKKVDDAIVIASKQSNKVFKKKHKGGIDDTIRQLICCHLSHQHTITSWPEGFSGHPKWCVTFSF